MKKAEKYDIFISYRRENGVETAKHLRDILTEKGYRVFFDTDSLTSGDFNQALFNVIEQCTDFIIILAPGALDRCVNEGDWVRQELAYALKKGKNIIPIMRQGFKFPKDLPDDIKDVRKQNGIEVNYKYFDAVVNELIKFLHSKPVKKIYKWLVPVATACCIAAAALILQPWKIQSSQPSTSPEIQSTPVQAESEVIEHIWGNYIPEGTATIITNDGTQYTAIANSLIRKAKGIEPSSIVFKLYNGFDNPSAENEYTAENMVYFKDMLSVSKSDGFFKVTDKNGVSKDISLLTDASLLFIGSHDTGLPQEVKEKNIVSIDFDWSQTPAVNIKYCSITQSDGSFNTPAALVWFFVNKNEGTGNPPSMLLSRDLSQYFDREIKISDLKRIEITKNPSEEEYPSSLEGFQTEMILYLKTGEQIELTVGKFFYIYAKAGDGLIHSLEKSRLSEIVFN